MRQCAPVAGNDRSCRYRHTGGSEGHAPRSLDASNPTESPESEPGKTGREVSNGWRRPEWRRETTGASRRHPAPRMVHT